MKVIFGYSPADDIVSSVYWKDSGLIQDKTLRTDGVTVDHVLNATSLWWVLQHRSSSHWWVYAAEVEDVRSAFKYLGKSIDLVFLLPDAKLNESD